MSNNEQSLESFNLNTMSGVFPGSRTQTYQRLRVYKSDEVSAQGQWAQLRWYSDPPTAALWPAQASGAVTPLFQMVEPLNTGDFVLRLYYKLQDVKLEAEACFACRHWQRQGGTNPEGIPVGRCTWGADALGADTTLPPTLAAQSALSLACDHFMPASPRRPVEESSSQPDASFDSFRIPIGAALDPDRLTFWPRLWHRLRRLVAQVVAVDGEGDDEAASGEPWVAQLAERSGVGAGTEPCFACHGRLANLGALAVESAEGDKQTLSVWRCRNCYTTYLNDWTDRWERLESLETEERYYRIAPADAYAALHIIHHTSGGDHPARRAERRGQRAQLLAIVVGRAPLSHQIRQGR